jgi:5'-methylthioadenosine phosphorylase
VIGVFGGSGFYAFLDDVSEVPVHTPYGPPSAPVTMGTLDGVSVAFMPRHGRDHEFPPHRVNYRANVWAMREVGVRRIIGPCAAGSLHPLVHPGDFVVLDQLVDRTWGRPDTYFDGGVVGHVSFADPYCPELRAALVAAGSTVSGLAVHPTGTVVVVQGPRFSTRAESNWYRSAGWEVINMTQYPESFLARELGLCYAGLALITDYDTGLGGVDGIEPVTIDAVFEVLRRNVARTRELLFAAIPLVAGSGEPGCRCAEALSSGPLGG